METVLEIEFQKIFEKWAWRITKQDESILKPNYFKDDEIGVYSEGNPDFVRVDNQLFIRGIIAELDNIINICTNEEKIIIEKKVKAINKKYGKLKDRLQEIWERQQNFDNIVFVNAGVTREGTTLHRKVALVAEVGEMFNENPDFKCWKKHKNTEVTDALKEEFVDVLHFLISLGIDIFRDEQEMFEWYCKKNNKNLERQRNRY